MLVLNLDYSDFVGRLAIGRIVNGNLGEAGHRARAPGRQHRPRARHVPLRVRGPERVEVPEAGPGDIVALAGFDEAHIGDTITDPDDPQPLERVHVDEPTVSMYFSINTSPFAGKEGQFVTSRNLKDRLEREILMNVALQVEPGERPTRSRSPAAASCSWPSSSRRCAARASSSRSASPRSSPARSTASATSRWSRSSSTARRTTSASSRRRSRCARAA